VTLGNGTGTVAVLAVGDGDGWTVDGVDGADGDAADVDGAGEACVDVGVEVDGVDEDEGCDADGAEEDGFDHGGVDENGPEDGPAPVDEVSGGVGPSVGRPDEPRLGAPVASSRGFSTELPVEGTVGSWVVAESRALNGTKNSRPTSASTTAANAPSLSGRGPPYRSTSLRTGFPCLTCVNLPPPGRLCSLPARAQHATRRVSQSQSKTTVSVRTAQPGHS
jgi:hypothetical protein